MKKKGRQIFWRSGTEEEMFPRLKKQGEFLRRIFCLRRSL